VTEDDARYTFACPNCAGSFSIGIERIPPVRARFSCPKCGKAMDFPSRDEARVYVQLQARGEETPAPAAPRQSGPAASASPGAPLAGGATPTAPPSAVADAPAAEATYRIDKRGYENDTFDRRSLRELIRTGAINELDSIAVGDAPPTRAADVPGLKSLFELRKNLKTTPPPICPRHTTRVAHYVCADSGRPLCEECAPEKKFGGAVIRVCDHCGGTSREIVVEA
jgi:hypothetical protein